MIMHTAKRCKRTSPPCSFQYDGKSRRSPEGLLFPSDMPFFHLFVIRWRFETTRGGGGWPIRTTAGVDVGFAWISGRQELSISRHALAIRGRMYCWNKPSSCSFSFPPRCLATDTSVGFLFKRTPGDILARYQTTVQWTTDSDRI